MESASRWKTAQRYEQGYWENVVRQAEVQGPGRLGGYKWRSTELIRMLVEVGASHLTDGNARVLEIGSGPVGVISFFSAAERVAIDPLEDFYSSRPALVASRDPAVSYRKGSGEDLPVDAGRYDLVIIENCIDHCRDMHSVMSGIRRALRPRGYLYLTVNARSRPGYYMHRLLSRLRIDAGHPHTFTNARLRSFLSDAGFDVLHLEQGSFLEAWFADLKDPSLKNRGKAILGVSEYLLSVIARIRS